MKVYVCDYCESKLGEIACSNSLGGSYCSVRCSDLAEDVSRECEDNDNPPYELDDLLSQCTHEEWPVELTANDIRWQPDRVIDLLANLARRVSSLERQVDSLSTQLTDTQRNVERQGVEIAEIKHLTESNEDDIRLLDNRSQVINAIQKYYDGGAR